MIHIMMILIMKHKFSNFIPFKFDITLITILNEMNFCH